MLSKVVDLAVLYKVYLVKLSHLIGRHSAVQLMPPPYICLQDFITCLFGLLLSKRGNVQGLEGQFDSDPCQTRSFDHHILH